MEKILDVREMAPKDRHSKIFGTFRELKPGESFILINDHEPKPLLCQFQAEHILYPESDEFLSETERSEVVKKAQLL